MTSISAAAHLLGVLFEQTQLEALVQLQLPDVPHLMEMLPGGVKLIQQTGHLAQREGGGLLEGVPYDAFHAFGAGWIEQ